VARLVALAHRFEGMVQAGQVKDYRELARLAQVSTARVAQIIVLAQLAPRIQEYVLFLSARSPVVARESMRSRPIFFFTAPLRKPRTEWACQPVCFDGDNGGNNTITNCERYTTLQTLLLEW
jgi:hypothetical protein